MPDRKFIYSAAFWLIAMAAQFSGFTHPAVSTLLAIAGAGFFVLAMIDHIRERRKQGKPIVEPHHLILIGLFGGVLSLAFVAIGFGWQTFWPARLAAAAPNSAAMPQSSPASDDPIHKARALASAEKAKLSEALLNLSSVLDRSDAVDEAGGRVAGVGNKINAHSTVQPSSVMELLERVEEENESFTRAVGRFANERYFQEFIIFVASPSYFDGLTTVSKGYRQYLGLWLSMEGKWDSALLLPAHEKFVHAYNQFKGDISTSRQRLKELRNAIR